MSIWDRVRKLVSGVESRVEKLEDKGKGKAKAKPVKTEPAAVTVKPEPEPATSGPAFDSGSESWIDQPLPILPGFAPVLARRDPVFWYTPELIKSHEGEDKGDEGRPWDYVKVEQFEGQPCLTQTWPKGEHPGGRNYRRTFGPDEGGLHDFEATFWQYQFWCDGYRDWVQEKNGKRIPSGGKGKAHGGGLYYEGNNLCFGSATDAKEQARAEKEHGPDGYAVYVMHHHTGAINLYLMDARLRKVKHGNLPNPDGYGISLKSDFIPPPRTWVNIGVLMRFKENPGVSLIINGKVEAESSAPLVKCSHKLLLSETECDRDMGGGDPDKIIIPKTIIERTRFRETWHYYPAGARR